MQALTCSIYCSLSLLPLVHRTIKPLVHFLLIACSGSYFVEWYCKGRHHVAHKKHDIEEGLKLLEEKRAAGGGGHGHH
jgi:hypothetical protein